MGPLIAAADVLVSPRVSGVNTPMKIYAYLNSGKAILATDIESHSQVLTSETALLEPPIVERFADGICRLADDPGLRATLASRAAEVAQEKYSQAAFAATVRRFAAVIEPLTKA
jgi:glycosyltransferase involved in cell wall biosynthesis